jgi:phosphoribosylamine--glycine ligase
MGAQSPHPTLNETELNTCKIWATNTANALKAKGILYSGPLFMGLLRDSKKGWCLLEYNARFGDPETQALVLRWKNNNFLRSNLGLSISENLDPELSPDKALCLALVHPQYPAKGAPLELPAWKIDSEKLRNTPDIKSEIFLTGSSAGRMAYLCLTGKTNTSTRLGNLAEEIMKDSPWAKILNWRRDPLNDI